MPFVVDAPEDLSGVHFTYHDLEEKSTEELEEIKEQLMLILHKQSQKKLELITNIISLHGAINKGKEEG